MNKKVSITFAVSVIILIGGTLAFIFLNIAQNFGPNVYVASNIEKKKTGSSNCPKHAFNGEAEIKGWYVSDGRGWLLQIASDDLEKLPAGYQDSRVILADAPDSLVAKLKKSSEKNPTELTIKGFYASCDGIPMVSIASGEEVFKKYLTQK
jgi:hypothetical protein